MNVKETDDSASNGYSSGIEVEGRPENIKQARTSQVNIASLIFVIEDAQIEAIRGGFIVNERLGDRITNEVEDLVALRRIRCQMYMSMDSNETSRLELRSAGQRSH
ncbi:hypothetical protein K503DRAFT_858491 [Rhizopogon vinicolor AM-OR11-026]|uniref:Uncharacterized protein n=1 Tax=Rhizopogon vinicolor AM-OR11-026 TaxID=1314800 RepID=A0A1B7MSQ0_9AGAM|nr:hypothetical protein K503DRAFT_858491 [Rhizopogon vinicolor AM-OR11-026]